MRLHQCFTTSSPVALLGVIAVPTCGDKRAKVKVYGDPRKQVVVADGLGSVRFLHPRSTHCTPLLVLAHYM